MSTYAPHPWDAIGTPPPLGADYTEQPTSRKYHAMFEYEATIEVVNASELDEATIQQVLAETHVHDIRWDNPPSEGDVSVVATDTKYKADYRVRIVDGKVEVL